MLEKRFLQDLFNLLLDVSGKELHLEVIIDVQG